MPKIARAFLKFLSHIKPRGTAILNRDDQRLRAMAARLKKIRPDIAIRWYSLRDANARAVATMLNIPGRHNVSKALAALRVATTLNVPPPAFL